MANPTAGVQQFTVPWGDDKRKWPCIAGAVTFYPMEMIGLNESGYADKFDDTESLAFLGVNAESVRLELESTDTVGTVEIVVERPFLFSMLIASAAITDVGKKVYARFSNEVQLADGTYGNYVGTIFARLSATQVLVAPPWSPFHGHRHESDLNGTFAANAAATTTLTKGQINTLVLLPLTAAATINLPAVADTSPGDKIVFLKTTSDVVIPTLDGNAAETINGASTLALPAGQYSMTEVISDGSAWFVNGLDAGLASGITHASFVYGEATPIDLSFFVASRKYRVRSIIVRPLVVGSDGGAVTAEIRKAPSGTAIASGTILHTGTADLKGTVNTNQTLTLHGTASNLEIASGDAIGMDVTGTTTAARGVVSVALEPVA